eukprot:TRINITY_DN101411_c0_g1_i10.p11 TRINITY_DN101411_c0_g1~~TRINITY_DN101411_c0_g1_i10.p11  ORF type:complete len:101 (+),score=7.11 TRINITY_DN101411_c0_g1_i10:1958-2260(+)
MITFIIKLSVQKHEPFAMPFKFKQQIKRPFIESVLRNFQFFFLLFLFFGDLSFFAFSSPFFKFEFNLVQEGYVMLVKIDIYFLEKYAFQLMGVHIWVNLS